MLRFFSKKKISLYFWSLLLFFLLLFVSHLFTPTLNLPAEVKGGVGHVTTLDHVKPPIHDMLETILWIPSVLLFSGREGRLDQDYLPSEKSA